MAKAIAIKVDDDLFRDIHIRAAQRGLSTQEYLTGLIRRDMFPELFPEQLPELTGEQLEQLRVKTATMCDTLAEIVEVLGKTPVQAADWGMTMIGGD